VVNNGDDLLHEKTFREMKIITHTRYAYLPDSTLGRFTCKEYNLETLWSIEREWNYNKRYVSCIPPDLYELVPHSGSKYIDTYALVNKERRIFATEAECKYETDRFTCVLHAGSWASNFEGCTGAGFNRIGDNRRWGVGRTVDGISYLLKFIGDNEITHINIRNHRFSHTPPSRQITL
jgi:hypothetical protein